MKAGSQLALGVRRVAVSAALGAIVGLFASGATGAGTAAAPNGPQPYASIQEIMDAIVDPAGDSLWDAVSSDHTAAGWEEHAPRTDDEWQAVRRNAISLIEGANLLVTPGRIVSRTYFPSEGAGVSDSVEVQRTLDRNRDTFVALARHFQDIAGEALAAVDARDPKALLAAGGRLDDACERCHMTFWYPHQKIPTLPVHQAVAPKP